MVTSQILIVLSTLPEASCLPSGLNSTLQTLPSWLSRVFRTFPVVTSQILIVLSTLPEASCCPSGLNPTLLTELSWPLRVFRSFPVVTSHKIIVLSSLPEASFLPSGLNSTLLTQSSWPSRVFRTFPVVTSQILIVLSSLPEASCCPSGLNSTLLTQPSWPFRVFTAKVLFSGFSLGCKYTAWCNAAIAGTWVSNFAQDASLSFPPAFKPSIKAFPVSFKANWASLDLVKAWIALISACCFWFSALCAESQAVTAKPDNTNTAAIKPARAILRNRFSFASPIFLCCLSFSSSSIAAFNFGSCSCRSRIHKAK